MPSLEERMIAALKVYCLWSWLSAHPDKGKRDYPLFEELIADGTNSSLCPWCDIYIYYWCKNCPLVLVDEDCGRDSSWFDIWVRAGKRYRAPSSEKQQAALLYHRGRAAGEIANLAWKEYKRGELLSGQAR